MANFKEAAEDYEPKAKIKNIADLDKVSINLDVLVDEEAEHPYKYVEVEGERYRVPNCVLADLKVILEERPEMEFFKVKKKGEGLDTSYTVISL